MLNKDKRIRIIIGHYGSGKTEFACNYAIELAKKNERRVVLADLDIVNPYFRSRERAKYLEKFGITVLSGLFDNEVSIDIPALGGIYEPLQNEDTNLILDVGGDNIGARVLRQYTQYLNQDNCDMLAVVNANRPGTSDLRGALNHIRAIEHEAWVKVTGLINNTHLLRETKPEDVIRGHKLLEEVSEALNVPILYAAILREHADELAKQLNIPVMPVDLIMRDEWM